MSTTVMTAAATTRAAKRDLPPGAFHPARRPIRRSWNQSA